MKEHVMTIVTAEFEYEFEKGNIYRQPRILQAHSAL